MSDDTVNEMKVREALVIAERPKPASALTAVAGFAWRSVLKIKHVPEQLMDALITPVLFLVMFVYLFGGAIEGSTSDYLQFLLPGMLVQSLLFSTVYSGMTLSTDLSKGFVDRVRTLPIWTPAPLVGASAGDSVRYVVTGTVLLATGFIMGYSLKGGIGGLLGAFALVIVFSYGLSWVFTTLGLILRTPTAVMNTGFMVLFPIIFISNIFVSPSTLPAFLEWLVSVNPVSHLTTAARGLMGGDADTGDIMLVLGETVAMILVFVPVTARLYRRR